MEDETRNGIGDIQSFAPPQDEVRKILEPSPECVGPVDGPVLGDAFEINRLFYVFPPELLDELDKVLRTEEQEHKENTVLVRAVIEGADKWGREEISKIKGETNNKIRTFISLENSDIQDARRICKEDKKRAKTNTKKEMKVLQEKLTEFLKLMEDTLEADLAAIRVRFKDIYKRVEDESKTRVGQTMSSVAEFTGTLQALTLEQLQELRQSGALCLGGDQLSVPGVALAEEETDDV